MVIISVMTTSKDSILHIRADKRLIERLRRIAARIDRPSSQIVREAVKAELDRIEGKGAK